MRFRVVNSSAPSRGGCYQVVQLIVDGLVAIKQVHRRPSSCEDPSNPSRRSVACDSCTNATFAEIEDESGIEHRGLRVRFAQVHAYICLHSVG